MTYVFLMEDCCVGLAWKIVMALHVAIRSVSMEVPARQLVTHLSAHVLRYVKLLYDICVAHRGGSGPVAHVWQWWIGDPAFKFCLWERFFICHQVA